MPPVAFGDDTDPRRWGFQGDSSPEAVVGPLHWPHPLGLGNSISASPGVERLENGDPYAEVIANGGIGEGREPIEDSHLAALGFRGVGDRGSPGSHSMDPRIGGDSDGTMISSGGGASSGTGSGSSGPSSRQGSPFTSAFDPPPQQVQHGGVMTETPSGVTPQFTSLPRAIAPDSANAQAAATLPSQQIRAACRAPLPGPSRHLPTFDDPVVVGPCVEHASAQLGHSLVNDTLVQAPEVMVGGGMISGSNLAVHGGVSASNCLPSGSEMSTLALVPGSRMSPVIGASLPSQQQQEHQQQRQMRAVNAVVNPGGGGSVIMESGPGRRPSVGPCPPGVPPSEDPNSRQGSDVPTVLEHFPGFVRCVMAIAPEVVGWVIGRSGTHIKDMKVSRHILARSSLMHRSFVVVQICLTGH